MLAALTGYVLLQGVVPALSRLDTDFPNYFIAARIVRDGQDTTRLYDDSWFQQQMRSNGVGSEGKFAPFPPPTALLLVPLAHFTPLGALRVVTVVNVLCLLLSMVVLVRMLGWHPIDAALFVLSSFTALISGLRFGQPYIVVSTCCLLGYYLHLRGKSWLAGGVLGLFVPIKYYPVIVLAVAAWVRAWKVLGGAALVILAISVASIGLLGWKIHETFLLSVLGNHLIGLLSLQDRTVPYSSVYQSFDTLFNRLFIFDPIWNPRPMVAAPLLGVLGLAATKAAILLTTAAILIRLGRNGAAQAAAPSIGLLGIVALLVAPATATYTFVLLWLPVALLMDYFLAQRDRTAAYFILGTYVLIGFIPYGFTRPFEGRGGLTVLAYPRLYVLLAMFIACVYFIARPRRDEPDASLFASAERR